jgi:hypothetical protein
LAVDAAPGKYTAQIEIGGFRLFVKDLVIDKSSPEIIPPPAGSRADRGGPH